MRVFRNWRFQLVAAVVFGVAGMTLLFSASTAPGTTLANHGGSGQYHTTWTATNLLRVQRIIHGDNPPAPAGSDEIAVGVTGWLVRGSFTEGSAFKEIWTAPSTAGMQFKSSTNNTHTNSGEPLSSAEIRVPDSSKWILGFVSPHNLTQPTYSLLSVGVGTAINNVEFEHEGGGFLGGESRGKRNVGDATSCKGDYMCMFVTGPYAWSDQHLFASAGSGKARSAAVAIPLEWTVSGNLCDNPNDPACQ